MKNSAIWCLFLVCCTCLAFTGGFFLGRNANRTPVQVSRFPETAETGEQNTGEKVNINTADLEQLQTLPQIGQVLAQRILDYRQANGPFAKPADIMNVPGIGELILDAILDKITVGG